MKPEKLQKYRAELEGLARRTGSTARSIEEAARGATGGDAGGNLSNAPMHLGDLGTEVYTQELNATLLEGEESLGREVRDALDRVGSGTFGICEECGKRIPEARLDAVPYARFCVPCAERLEQPSANLNTGRVPGWGSSLEDPSALAKGRRDGEQSPFNAPRSRASDRDPDPHAAGTPGGGTAVGGLAGSNVGDGEPVDDVDTAMGSGNYDADGELDREGDDADDENAFSGRSGGAVGGTPANKRVSGGK